MLLGRAGVRALYDLAQIPLGFHPNGQRDHKDHRPDNGKQNKS
tara:strand:- start:140246 stop:140374 length:129 start_codon:yes stop_codon:yes gene_type:complete